MSTPVTVTQINPPPLSLVSSYKGVCMSLEMNELNHSARKALEQHTADVWARTHAYLQSFGASQVRVNLAHSSVDYIDAAGKRQRIGMRLEEAASRGEDPSLSKSIFDLRKLLSMIYNSNMTRLPEDGYRKLLNSNSLKIAKKLSKENALGSSIIRGAIGESQMKKAEGRVKEAFDLSEKLICRIDTDMEKLKKAVSLLKKKNSLTPQESKEKKQDVRRMESLKRLRRHISKGLDRFAISAALALSVNLAFSSLSPIEQADFISKTVRDAMAEKEIKGTSPSIYAEEVGDLILEDRFDRMARVEESNDDPSRPKRMFAAGCLEGKIVQTILYPPAAGVDPLESLINSNC